MLQRAAVDVNVPAQVGNVETRKRRFARKAERLEARVSAQQKAVLQRAAELRGMTLTEFVVASSQAAAERAIQDDEMIKLSVRDREVFVAALLNPPAPNERLLRAARRYKETFRK